ncbi:MAG: cysteine-rich CWC family protein [Simplicispira suum]|uniref:cysteine-rich CWC family protein n=1 Tax=Simplicispira suum TaxID=2109915 RepID=UPI001C6B1146|nr:cysteine-rich CWC family protein [Simplicispira suum]MBW7833865.1 cysteine-rich CWC family protein [Simplicispira suum]
MTTPLPESATAAALRCPLCEQDNACSMAACEDAAQCWCMGMRVSPLALARVASQDRQRRCLCAACAQAAAADI